jgi:hypothetical protein
VFFIKKAVTGAARLKRKNLKAGIVGDALGFKYTMPAAFFYHFFYFPSLKL